nr:type II secretion system minor pseudopilin GspK [Nitrosomonas nitrosa]
MKSRRHSARDEGAALAAVLTMLAVMSLLAVIVVDAANMSVRRTSNLVRMEQTRWYLLGAEAFAVSQLEELRRRSETARVDEAEWQGRPFVFPLEDGSMEVELWDGGNCFNLNSLVVTDDGGHRFVSPGGLVQLARLFDAVAVGQQPTGLGPALVDWLDTDSHPMAGGAEDGAYAGESRAYVVANALLADISDLNQVRGFSPDVVDAIAPYACVRPTSAPNQINPNTLRVDQAPLLAMAIDGLRLERAAQIIRDRPRGGWETVDDFLQHPALGGLELNEAGRAQFSLQTRYVVMRTRVARADARESAAVLLERGVSGNATIVRRVFGAGAGATLL